MCQPGTDTIVRVKIAAELSSTGQEKWKDVGIDSCIAGIVAALQAGGIDMLASCCGHGKRPGRIDLRDGRVLLICADEKEADRLESANEIAAAARFIYTRIKSDEQVARRRPKNLAAKLEARDVPTG